MHVISQKRLREYADKYPGAANSLATWIRVAQRSRWQSIEEVRQTYPTADPVSRLTVFNIGGNKYRLITYIDYRFGKVFIRGFLPHSEYSKDRWKNDPWAE